MLGGAVVLIVLTLLTNWLTERATKQAYTARGQRNVLVGSSQRNIESIKTMGMMDAVTSMWDELHSRYRSVTLSTSDTAGMLGAMSRTFRLLLQSGVMAIGAVLVIDGHASAGSIIAGSILSAKALGPVEHAIANWRSFMTARQGWKRVNEFLEPGAGTHAAALPAAPAIYRRGRSCNGWAAQWRTRYGRRYFLHAERRRRARHHWPKRVRQVHAGTPDDRHLAL